MTRLALLLAALLLAVAGCGDDDSAKSTTGGGASQQSSSENGEVEKAAKQYILESQSDEDDKENAGAISVVDVEVDGDSAKVEAKSSLTGNRYEATLTSSGGEWRGTTLFKDAPSEGSPGDDPSAGAGREIPSDEVEAQITARLVKPLGLDGKVTCPPTVRLRRGNNFECKLTGGRRNVTIAVTQKDDEGNLNYKLRTTP